MLPFLYVPFIQLKAYVARATDVTLRANRVAADAAAAAAAKAEADAAAQPTAPATTA